MKTSASFLAAAISIIPAVSCNGLFPKDDESGFINLSIVENSLTRASKGGVSAALDTNAFILTVSNSSGKLLYQGKYGDSPQNIIADPGSYTVDIVSKEFSEPAFDSPQYGDTRLVTVTAGKTSAVRLECTQINSGVKLNINSDFLTAYPNGILMLRSSEGRLIYGYSEKRIAYFKAGSVALELSDGSTSKTLFTRQLSPRQILVINISTGITTASNAGISVSVDTSRYWSSETYVIGGGSQGDDTSDAISVSEAAKYVGKTDVWVHGYIVGGDLSSSRCSFEGPFLSNTNIAIASRSSCKDKESCVSVQLSKGDIRDALNLVDNPGNLGRQVYLKGDIVEKYYGITGIQCVTEYRWK